MNEKTDLILMANTIIGSKFKLSANEIKIFLNFVNLLGEENSDFWTFTIPAKSFNIDHKKLKASAKKLMSKPALEIPKEYNPNLPKDEQEWLYTHWFADIEYKNGRIEASFSPKLKPYLVALKKCYTGFNLRYILPLQSQYSIRIYQLLKAEKFKNKKVTFKLEYLYDIFQVPKSYMDYMQFNRRILKQAQSELKEHTDIYFEYEAIKDGRKVIEITFTIYTNKKNQTFELNKEASKLKRLTGVQYSGHEIIEYQGVRYRVNNNFDIDGVDSNKAMEIWQYIYNNQDKLLSIPLQLKPQELEQQWKLTQELVDDLLVEFGVAQSLNKELISEFEDYLEEQEKVFIKFCIDNDKHYKDMNISFKRHLINAEAMQIDFFAKLR